MDVRTNHLALAASSLVEEVEISRVQSDPTYQRGLKSHHRKFGKNFDRSAAGTPTLGRRADGSLWVIDGLQRLGGMAIAGITHWPCLVIPSTGPEFEAGLFAKINRDRKQVSQPEQFKAALTQRDPHAVAAKRAVEMLGYTIPAGTSGNSANLTASTKYITCHGTLYKIAKTYGEAILYRTLDLLIKTWPGNPTALQSICVAGLAQLLYEHGDLIDDDRFVKNIGLKSLNQVIQYAQADLFGSMPVKFKKAVVKLYNKRLHKKNQIRLGKDTGESDD